MAEGESSISECRIVGRIRSQLRHRQDIPPQADADLPPACIEMDGAYREALSGLRPGSEAQVVTWLHEADRKVLQCHPRGDPSRPMRGVFATRSPDRPNPIGLHPVRILAVDGLSVTVHPMEALDGTPVLDIKPLIATEGKDSPPWGPDIPAEVGEALRFVGREAWERGLVSGKNGNLSQSRNGKRMVITCHGSAPGRLGPGDLVSVDFASLPEGAPESASSESRMHAAIYRAQPLAGAVLHTHPPSLLALSLLHSGRRMLQLPLYEAATVAEEMILVPGSEPGDPELAENVARAARDKRAVFLQGHGLVCWGEDLEQALDLTEELVSLARIQLLSGG